MVRTLITLFCLFASVQSFAGEVMIKVGVNNSWFATEDGSSEIMPAFGIGVQFPLDESQKVKLGFDALYVEQKMILKDKSWQAHAPFIDECGATFGDLHLHYHYLKIPIYLQTIVYQKRNFFSTINAGASINFTLKSSSRGKNRRYEEGYCNYDYRRIESDRQPKYPVELVLGSELGYKAIGLEILYSYTFGKTEFLYGLEIQDHIHSIRTSLILHFNK